MYHEIGGVADSPRFLTLCTVFLYPLVEWVKDHIQLPGRVLTRELVVTWWGTWVP